MARSVSRFRLKPKSCIKKTAPMSDTGIAKSGTNTDRIDPRKRKITMTTMASVSSSVLVTSSIALSMYSVAS